MACLPAGVAAASPTQSSKPLLIDDVRLVAPGTGGQERMSVLVERGKIAAIAPGGTINRPDAARIEGRGRYLMPGLTDMHVHVWDQASLGAYLAHGITTVRNASGMPMHLRLARQIETGALAGPRLITTGPILNSNGPNAQINHQLVETPAEARAAVRAQHAAGFRRLKLYSNLSRDSYLAIRDEARALGMTMMGHSPEGRRSAGIPVDKPFAIAFDELVDDGFTTFEHIETIVWHGLRDRHDDQAMRRLSGRLAAAGAVVDPTLLAFRNLLHVAETRGEFLKRDDMSMMNPLLVASEQANYQRWSNEDVDRNRAAYEFYQRATSMLHEAGVTIVAGSDAGIFANPPGVSLIDELHLLVESGLTRREALQAATVNASRIFDGDGGGTIAVGSRADLVLLDSDPTEDLDVLRDPAAVIANGRYFDRPELRQLLAAGRNPDPERTRRNLLEGLTAQGSDVTPLLGLE